MVQKRRYPKKYDSVVQESAKGNKFKNNCTFPKNLYNTSTSLDDSCICLDFFSTILYAFTGGFRMVWSSYLPCPSPHISTGDVITARKGIQMGLQRHQGYPLNLKNTRIYAGVFVMLFLALDTVEYSDIFWTGFSGKSPHFSITNIYISIPTRCSCGRGIGCVGISVLEGHDVISSSRFSTHIMCMILYRIAL